MRTRGMLFVGGLLFAASSIPAVAQVTSVDAVTGTTLGDPQFLLYQASPGSIGNRAAVGNEIWFVSDGGTAGIPTGQVSKETVDAIAAGTGDDKRFAVAAIDGTDTLVDQPGRFYQTNLSYPETEQGKSVYVYLWSDSHGGDVGDTFGILDLTVGNGRIVPPTGLANFEFHINAEIFADSFTVVPEPSSYAAMFGLLCASAVFARRLIARPQS